MPSSSTLCSAFVYFPLGGIMTLSTKFDSTDERYTIHHLTGQVCSVIVQRTFCPSHIRYIVSLSRIHPLLILQSPLVDLSLSVACPLHMPYSCILCSPCTFHEDPHRHRDDFHQRITPDKHFCIFLLVRRPLNLSVNM